VPLTAIATAVIAARILGLDAGFAAGLFSGATTESPAIGTAAEAIRALPLPKEQRDQMISHIAVADALCYLFGALGVILMTTVIGPAILRIDVAEEARKLEEKYGFTQKRAGIASAWRPVEIRAYAIAPGAALIGQSVAAVEAGASGQRVFYRMHSPWRSAFRADRVQMESSERVKMLEKQSSRAGCVNLCERNTL
jgi:putative transport protein